MPQLPYPQERPSTHCIGGWVGPRASLDGCETHIKQDIKLFLKWCKNYPSGTCKIFNCAIPGTLEAVHIEFWEHQLGPSPAIWTVWVADCCVCVWVLSAVNGTLWVADCCVCLWVLSVADGTLCVADFCVCVWVLAAANWTMWVVVNVFGCAVHMGSSRRSHGSCITHTSTTGLTMTRKDPGVTYSWKRGKKKVNSRLCCQVEVTCLRPISCCLLTCLCKIMGYDNETGCLLSSYRHPHYQSRMNQDDSS